MANSVSINALRPEIWAKELWKDAMDNMYFTQNGMMGKGKGDTNAVVWVNKDLKKSKGDTVTVPLTTKLSGNGVDGDSELEGNEEAISAYSESILIDQKRFGVRLTGQLDEQKNAYDMRTDAKNKLSIRLQEFIERQIFLKLAGVTNTSLTDIAGTVVDATCAWSNTPDYIPDADTAAGYGDRYLCADYTSGAASLATTDLLTPALISRAKIKAQIANPKVLPLRIKGKDYYVLFVHPYQAFDLKNNATYAQAQREAASRGSDNPIFTGALGIWDGVIVHEHEYVPWLDISVAGNSFRGAATGTNFTADCCRALLCGRQAVAYVQAKNPNSWVEKSFDYKNKTGFATGLIGGIQKVLFNSKEYGVVALDTAITSLV